MPTVVRPGKPFTTPAMPLKALPAGKQRCGMCSKPLKSLKSAHKTRTGLWCTGVRYVRKDINA